MSKTLNTITGIAISELPNIIKLIQGLIDSHNNGQLTQEQFDAKWAVVVSKVVSAESRWDAAARYDKP